MTQLSSSITAASALDFPTLNTVRSAVLQALRSKVCEWEQQALDAAARGEYRSAQQYKDWAFAADLTVHVASNTLSGLAIQALDHLCVVEDRRTVELPDLRRSEDLYLDVLQTELASQQPCPEV